MSDYRAMQKHVCAPAPVERLLWIVMVFIASFGLAVAGRNGRAALAGMLAGFLLILAKALLAQRRLQPRRGGAVLCRYELELTESGLHAQTPNWKSETAWRGILAVEETAAHCFLRLDAISVYAIPKRSFPNGEAMQQFIDFARDRVSRARGAEGEG